MTKAKIVVAAKVGHQVVVRVAVADQARAVTHRPLAGSIKRAHPRRAVRREMKKAKRHSAPVAQPNLEERAKIRAKSVLLSPEARKALVTVLLATVRFHRARRGIISARASAHLSQEGIALQAIGLMYPARHGRVRAMKSVHSAHGTTGPGQIGLVANALLVNGRANQQAFVERRAALVRQRSIQASVLPK